MFIGVYSFSKKQLAFYRLLHRIGALNEIITETANENREI